MLMPLPVSLPEFVQRLVALLWHQAFMLLSLAGIITSMVMLRVDHRFEVKRVRGMTRHTAALLVTGLLVIFLLLVGLLAIEARGDKLPVWVSFALPGSVGLFFALAIWFKLKDRPSFTWDRFTEAVVIPLVIPFVPLFGTALPQLWRVFRQVALA